MTTCTIYDDVRVSLADPEDPEAWVTKRGLKLKFEKLGEDKWLVTGPPKDIKIMSVAAAAWERWDSLITRLYAENYAQHDRIDAMSPQDAADRATAKLRKAKAGIAKAPVRKARRPMRRAA